MSEKNTRFERAVDLRRRAEEETARADENGTLDRFSPEETRRVLHELRVHQIELEMQNEELRRAQEEIEVSRARYFDLYDLAPVGYVTLSENGLILEANLTAATLFGVARGALAKQPLPRFILPEDQGIYYRRRKQLLETGSPQVCEVRMLCADAAAFWARLEATVVQDAAVASACRVVVSDITEYRQTQEALWQLEKECELSRKFRAILDQAFGFIGLTTPDGTLVEANRAALKFAGVEESDVFEKPFWETPWWTHSKEMQDQLRDAIKVAASGEFVRFEATHLASDGQIHYVDFSLKPIQDESGKVVFLLSEGRDVTDRKLAEEGMREFENRFRDLIENSREGVIFVDTDTKTIVSGNRAMANMLGRPPEELAGLPLLEIHPPDSHDRVVQEFEQHRSGERQLSSNMPVICKDGSRIYVDIISTTAMLNGVKYLSGFFRDVTERWRAEEALRESGDRIRKKLDAILLPEGDIGTLELVDVVDTAALQRIMDDVSRMTRYSSAIVDLHGNILVAAGWQDVCGKFHRVHPTTCKHCRESDVMLSAGVEQGQFKAYKCKNNMWDVATPIIVGGTHLGNLFLGQFFFEDESLDYDAFRVQARQYGFDEEEYLAALDRVPRRSREEIDVAMDFCARLATLVSTLSYSRIKLSRALMAGEQSKEQLEQYTAALETANKALEESNRAAECASRAKSDFLANMSHELRTPLNAVIGFSEGLLERADIHPLNEHQKNRLEKIKTNGEYLLQLINGVLDIAKVESGKVDVRITTFDVEPVVWEVGDMAEALVKNKPAVRFILDLEQRLPPIASDRDKIRQILVNLLGNAIKFTEQGSVTLRVRGGDGSLLFSVEDTGAGISAEHLDHLFEQFYQVEQETRRSLKGTGLGLAISRAFATLLGGTLTVESVLGQGSAFTLTMPLVYRNNAAEEPLQNREDALPKTATVHGGAETEGDGSHETRQETVTCRRSCWSKTTPITSL